MSRAVKPLLQKQGDWKGATGDLFWILSCKNILINTATINILDTSAFVFHKPAGQVFKEPQEKTNSERDQYNSFISI